MKKHKQGEIVRGNKYAGKARGDTGVVVSADMAAPRSVKVKFRHLGYWLICPDELARVPESEITPELKQFAATELANAGPAMRTARGELVDCLREALGFVDEEELRSRIEKALAGAQA